jgi:hypothetical protein
MKKIGLLLGFALLLEYGAIAQKNKIGFANHASQGSSTVLQKQSPKELISYYSESFEGSFPPAGWTKQNPDGGTGWAQAANGDSLNGWGIGTQDVPPCGGNFVSYCTWITGGAISNDQWLISPRFNVSSGDSLKFSLWWYGPCQDTVQILLSTATNSIADFTTTLLQADTLTLAPMGTWKKFTISLTPYAGQSVYIAFREKVSDNMTNGAYIALDLFSIGTHHALDAGISAKIAPVDAACGLQNEDVTVIVQNYGTTAINNLPVHYTVNGGTPVDEIIPNTISSDSSVNYTFTTQASLSAPEVYTIKAYTSLTGDENNTEDTLTFTATNIPNSLPPYSMGFELAESFAGWLIEDANNDGSTWTIDSTGGNTGPYCAKYSYNIDSTANDWLFSKCILLDASKTYKLSYWVRAESENYPESLKVQIGNAPASTAMTTLIDDLPNISNTVYFNRDVNFTIPSDGVYYFGWKCYSAANMWNLYLDDINISDITGIEETTTSMNIKVFPNPAKDVLTVYSSTKIAGIRLFNVYGQLVLSSQVNSANMAINTKNLADGIYYLQIETKDGITTKNVIIRK